MLRLIAMALALPFLAASAPAQTKETSMPHLAHGTFTVNLQPLSPAPAEGLSRFSIDKQIHGDLEGASKGEMLGGGDFKQGAAGYVAMEAFRGTLSGKRGGFALQHMATMEKSGQKLSIVVVPGSGTEELKGITGTFTIQIANGIHSYDFEYTLPGQ